MTGGSHSERRLNAQNADPKQRAPIFLSMQPADRRCYGNIERATGVYWGASMPGRGVSTFRQSASWIAGSLVALFVGLVMFMHEQHAHDVCVTSIRVIGRSFAQPPSSCGFADTAYWSGVVVFLAGAISLIGAMWSGFSALSGSGHLRGRVSWPSGHGPAASPDLAAHGLPEPKPWLTLTSPAPFEAPKRQAPQPQAVLPQAVMPQTQQTGSASGAAVKTEARPVAVSAPAPQPVDVVTSAPQPAPAWYPDPNDPAAIRWWDGAKWGESRPRPA
jgi:hypothetical protein